MAKILVTGGAGFIGSHLVDALISRKHTVTVVDDLSQGKREYVAKGARFICLRVQDSKMKKIIRDGHFSYIYHLAAQKNLQYSRREPFADAETNILGSLQILQAAKLAKVKKIIFFSTAAVYDPKQKQPVSENARLYPATPYGVSKLAFEQYLRAFEVPHVVLRLSNVFGPRQDGKGEGGVVSIFCEDLVQDRPPRIHNSGAQTRDFIFVSDVVRAAIAALHPKAQGVYNVSSAKETSIRELCATLLTITKSNYQPLRGSIIPEQRRSALTNNRIRQTLGWFPKTSLLTGLHLTFQWFDQQALIL
ncbi:MAG: NAD-dependent epimerase/dehydratase family protein [Patescibacteria group bacterium]|jgi:UDP-glucose 4-epimerase